MGYVAADMGYQPYVDSGLARVEDAAREMARDMFVKSQIDQEALARKIKKELRRNSVVEMAVLVGPQLATTGSTDCI